MIEALKEISDIIKQLPHLSIWILAGLLFYKVVIIGSWFGIARLVILKTHDLITKHMEEAKQPQDLKIGNILIDDKLEPEFRAAIANLRTNDLCRIHQSDIDWLMKATNQRRAEQEDARRKRETKI